MTVHAMILQVSTFKKTARSLPFETLVDFHRWYPSAREAKWNVPSDGHAFHPRLRMLAPVLDDCRNRGHVSFVVVLFGQNGIGSHDYSFVGVV
jgi:hypothetical protein